MGNAFDVHPDGDRFLVIKSSDARTATSYGRFSNGTTISFPKSSARRIFLAVRCCWRSLAGMESDRRTDGAEEQGQEDQALAERRGHQVSEDPNCMLSMSSRMLRLSSLSGA